MIFARNLILVLVVPWPGARATGLGSIQINPQQIRFLPSKDEKTKGFFSPMLIQLRIGSMKRENCISSQNQEESRFNLNNNFTLIMKYKSTRLIKEIKQSTDHMRNSLIGCGHNKGVLCWLDFQIHCLRVCFLSFFFFWYFSVSNFFSH